MSKMKIKTFAASVKLEQMEAFDKQVNDFISNLDASKIETSENITCGTMMGSSDPSDLTLATPDGGVGIVQQLYVFVMVTVKWWE